MENFEHAFLKSRAPVRIDLAGGWTDVAPYSAEEGGAVVNAGITRYTYATLVPRSDGVIHIVSADFDTFVEVRSFRELEYDNNLDLIKAAIRRTGVETGMNVFVRCDAPPGSGTGTSASLSVTLIGLLNMLHKAKLSSHEIAMQAFMLETEELKIAGGKQDQYGAALGGINYIDFHDPVVSASRLRVEDRVLCELEKQLIMCYTGRARLSGNIISAVMGAYRGGVPATVNALRGLKRVAQDMKSVLLNGDLADFGELLQQNWAYQKDLHPSVTNPQMESLFDVAYSAGAAGGKALGAGGGGCLLFYCKPNQEHVVRRRLEQAGVQMIDFNFDLKGLQTWRVNGPSA